MSKPPQLYQTITGRIQCCKVAGALFVRTWNPETGRVGPWEQRSETIEELHERYVNSVGDERYRYGCMGHCLSEAGRSSIWFVESAQDLLDREISKLRLRFTAEIERERNADWPTIEPAEAVA